MDRTRSRVSKVWPLHKRTLGLYYGTVGGLPSSAPRPPRGAPQSRAERRGRGRGSRWGTAGLESGRPRSWAPGRGVGTKGSHTPAHGDCASKSPAAPELGQAALKHLCEIPYGQRLVRAHHRLGLVRSPRRPR